jgi:hypothetical protein
VCHVTMAVRQRMGLCYKSYCIIFRALAVIYCLLQWPVEMLTTNIPIIT